MAAIPQLSAHDVERLIALWNSERERWHDRVFAWTTLTLITSLVVLIAGWEAFALLPLTLSLLFYFTAPYMLPPRLERLLRQLAAVDNPECIGPLVDALGQGNLRLQEAASSALVRLLPRLSDTEARSLGRGRWNILCTCFGNLPLPMQQALYLAVLRKVPADGNPVPLTVVAHLVAAERSLHLPQERLIQEEAERCLERLLDAFDPLAGKTPEVAITFWSRKIVETYYPTKAGADESLAILARPVIARLLRLISPESFRQLPKSVRLVLYQGLLIDVFYSEVGRLHLSRLGADYPVALLQMVRKTGDVVALPWVRNFIVENIEAPPEAHEVAKELLPQLEALAKRNKENALLLRAGQEPKCPPQEMLRPSTAYKTSEENLLHIPDPSSSKPNSVERH
ncbi:hypothetical protein CWRG_01898 [Chthonomonas calidirosea]|uniref:hypothetical protein n=1 Tax=Chthonomonas calidirosea TaxID=454171 RepID=UPI0006DD4F54|nr:hypothetical protein [Chthonomonas calidirosea]CEK17631.1 hypothetical protein CWRG_01898 [Chthonomonas calidirosea]CEK17632.1 hypothetical protein CP488_01915 [Chthonomonas calidirosea]